MPSPVKNGSGLACAKPSEKNGSGLSRDKPSEKTDLDYHVTSPVKTRSGRGPPACRRVIARGESIAPHASNTDLGDTIPRRIRRPVGKRTTTCRDCVCGRLAYDWGELQ